MRTTKRMVESILYLRVLIYALNSFGGRKVPSAPHALASVASQRVFSLIRKCKTVTRSAQVA
jgi:hypothetical protein